MTQAELDLKKAIFADARNKVNRALAMKAIYGMRLPSKMIMRSKILEATVVELKDYVLSDNETHDYIYELEEFAKRKCLLTFVKSSNIDDFSYFDEDIIIVINDTDVQFKATTFHILSTNLTGVDQYDSINAQYDVAQNVEVTVNSAELEIGNGVKTKDCYFSGDSGTTAKALDQIKKGDRLYLNPTNIGYDLNAGWVITITIL